MSKREYRSRHYDLHRSAILTFKLEAGCVDCGGTFEEYPEVLQFDHVRGDKDFAIGRAANIASLDRLVEEIDKCEVVCANCHQIRSLQRARAG